MLVPVRASPDEGEKLRASAEPPEPAERKALSRFRPHTLVEAKELLPLTEFTSKHEFLHQAQRRFTTVVHNRNWRDLALELRQEGSAGSRSALRGKKGKAQAKGRERAKVARGLAGGGPLRGGEPRRRRRLPQRHPNAG